MRRRHLEALQPVCCRCLAERGEESRLVLARVIKESDAGVREGILHCPFEGCRLEYPIIDGFPILVANVREYVAQNLPHITARGDLSAEMEGLLGDCAGPGSIFDTTRQHLSSYVWDHYGDLDPAEDAAPVPGSLLRCLARGLALMEQPLAGHVLDVGCAVGRSTFALAAAPGTELILGVDLHYPMLSVAARVLEEGTVRYPRRRVGLVYERREFEVRLEGAERVDFWICDALALPFANQSFSFAAAMNVIDCVTSPVDLLRSLARVLRPGARALLATPYDWSAAATPMEAWLGAHSQRGGHHGASEPVLRDLLTPGAHPASIENLELLAEEESVPWQVRMHERSMVEYRVHLLLAAAVNASMA